MKTATPKQLAVFHFIVKYTKQYGQAPTLVEMQDAMCYGSPFTIQCKIQALIRKGYIRRVPGKWRGIEILKRVKQ